MPKQATKCMNLWGHYRKHGLQRRLLLVVHGCAVFVFRLVLLAPTFYAAHTEHTGAHLACP